MRGAEFLVAAALALDALLGDPRGLPHPTRAMGSLAVRVERLLHPGPGRAAAPSLLLRGALAWFLVVGASVGGAALLLALGGLAGGGLAALAVRFGAPADRALFAEAGRSLAGVYLVYAAIAPRDLAAHAIRVARALSLPAPEGGLAAGRAAVAMIVGRDVSRLDEAGVARAAVESVAESAVDGVCAPLLWALLLGPLGAIAYRAANTLDSMWGHKDVRYLHFGRLAARADDALTWPAARLAFPAAIGAAALAALALPRRFSPARALAIGLRDRRRHASPNSAWLEAAFAGALGLRLAGPAWYGGELLDKPTIGDDSRPIEVADIGRAVLLMYLTTLLFAGAGLALVLAARALAAGAG